MQFANLDTLTRRWLLERKLPLHYYTEGLFNAATCLRELALRGLTVVNSKTIVVNSYGAFDLPDDFQDDLGVFLQYGQRTVGLPEKNNLNPLRITDSNGAYVPYSGVSNGSSYDGWYAGGYNINDYGEPTGRQFGSSGGTNLGYQVFKERRQVQMSESFIGKRILFLYIGTGQSIDNATQIDWFAASTIQAYMDWAASPYVMDKDSAPARKYYNELQGLGFGIFSIGTDTIKNIVRQASSGFIKN